MKSAPTIAFDYRPSRWIGIAAGVTLALGVLAPWLSALPLLAQAAISLTAFAAGLHALQRHARPPFCRIAWRASGWSLIDAAGAEHAALLGAHAHLGVLLALNFRHGPRSTFHALLLPDNLDAQTRRRLILLLARGEVAHAE
ncbi:MAG: hypothetical protein ABW187_08580 [Dokdonella sp.]